MPLDDLPLDLLLALRDAVGDPTDEGRERAAKRALDAGFYLQCTAVDVRKPIEMEPAQPGIEAVDLSFIPPE